MYKQGTEQRPRDHSGVKWFAIAMSWEQILTFTFYFVLLFHFWISCRYDAITTTPLASARNRKKEAWIRWKTPLEDIRGP